MEEAETKTPENKDPLIVRYINDRVHKKRKSFVALTVGAVGSGKSYASLRLAQLVDPTFKIDRVAFRAADFMRIVNDLVARQEKGEDIRGKVIMWDEIGCEHNSKEFMSKSNRVVNSFFQTSRHLQLCCLMTVPLLQLIDSSTRKLCHAVIEMVGLNVREKKTIAKIKILQTNVMSGREYPKYLRFTKNGRTRVVKRVSFNLPTKDLLDAYELKKKAFTTSLNKEIMATLEDESAKKQKTGKSLTPMQRRVIEMLKTMSVESAAKEIGVSKTAVYLHKEGAEAKGIVFTPKRQGSIIIAYEINDNRDTST